MSTPQRFWQDIHQNPINATLLAELRRLQLPDCWLVAGCLFQTVWNVQSGNAPTAHIADYDLFYFDAADLSEAAEAAVQQRVDAEFAALGVRIEAKNQARVHTWYADYFHEPYSALANSQESLGRFLIECTCVGVRIPNSGAPSAADVVAVHGLADLYAGILRPNWVHRQELFEAKALSYQRRWPGLRVMDCTG